MKTRALLKSAAPARLHNVLFLATRSFAESAERASLTEQDIASFHDAVQAGDLAKSKDFLSRHGVANVRNKQGWTPLMVAAKHGHTSLVQLLLQNKGSTTTLSPSGHTATELAAFWNQKSSFDLLVAASKTEVQEKKYFFTDNPLDPSGSLRNQRSQLYDLAQQRNSRFIMFQGKKPIVVPLNRKGTKFGLFTRSLPQIQGMMNCDVLDISIFLGCHKGETVVGCEQLEDIDPSYQKGGAWFAVQISETQAAFLTSANQAAVPLPAYPAGMLQLTEADATVCGKASSLLDWHRANNYCMLCGEQTSMADAGYKRTCHNDTCASNTKVLNSSHPRVDPSIITLILSEDESKCLLGRQKRFLPGMYSCLAGFVEPCESVEDACHREVAEEVGLQLSRVTYHSSQPWPMPSTLMLGFIAHAKYATPKIDQEELEDVRWFSRQEAVSLLTHSHPESLHAPPRHAVAHQLIKNWLLKSAFKS